MSATSSSPISGQSFGVVEGFYWRHEHRYKEQFGEYTHDQRRKLIQFLAKKGLNSYVYDPKVTLDPSKSRCTRAVEVLAGESLSEWRDTFKLANRLGVEFIWGLSPKTCADRKASRIYEVVRNLIELGVAGVALLFDDTMEEEDITLANKEIVCNKIRNQTRLINDLFKEFDEKIIKAYCPPCYRGEPEELVDFLEEANKDIPPSIPFVLTGLKRSESLELGHFPSFENRRIVVWDNWIAKDDIRIFRPFPPQGRQPELLKQISGYWLNLAFPLERVIPVVSSIASFRSHLSHPGLNKETIQELGEEWGNEIDVSSEFTKAILRVKFDNRDANVNPEIDSIIETSDLNSIDLLCKAGLDINAPLIKITQMASASEPCSSSTDVIYPIGLTLIQLAASAYNYPLARFLKAWGADDRGIDWAQLQSQAPARKINPERSEDDRLKIVSYVDRYLLLELRQLLDQGVSAATENRNNKSLAEDAEWHACRHAPDSFAHRGYTALAAYLRACEELEQKALAVEDTGD